MKHIKKSVLDLTKYSVSQRKVKIKLDQNDDLFLPVSIS